MGEQVLVATDRPDHEVVAALEARLGANLRVRTLATAAPEAGEAIIVLKPHDLAATPRGGSPLDEDGRWTRWQTVAPLPTKSWAEELHGLGGDGDPLDRLWDEFAVALRLDQDDPTAAWLERHRDCERRAAALQAESLDCYDW